MVDKELVKAALGCVLTSHPCLECTDRFTKTCCFPDIALEKVTDALNAGVDPESLGVTLVKEEQEESELDLFKRHFDWR